MKGYYKTDSPSAFDEEGFLKTGDVGYFDDRGCVYVVDRIKEMFKYNCWNISPAVIESVLNEHPSIKEAAVVGVPVNEETGDLPTACVVLFKAKNASGKEIEDFVAERVADFERLRGGVVFVKKLPRTPTGKIIRNDVKTLVINNLRHKV